MHVLIAPQTPVISIPIADKPPRLGGVIREFTQVEFRQIFGLPCQEGIWLDTAFPQAELEKVKKDNPATTLWIDVKIQHAINHPFQYICIAKIDEQVGYGVFARKLIKKGTLVCIYSGEIGSSIDGNLNGLMHGFINSNFCFKQTYARCAASFLQHLPIDPKNFRMLNPVFSREEILQEVELYCIRFQSAVARSNLATLNLEKKYLIYRGVPIVAFVTNRDIEAGEQLGIKYGFRYWRAMKIQPELFEKSGKVMSKRDYQRSDDPIIDNQEKWVCPLARL